MGLIYKWARLFSLMPRTANWLSHSSHIGRTMRSMAGISPQRELPKLAIRSFTDWAGDRPVRRNRGPRVMLWPDTFNNYFSPEIAKAAVVVLEDAGYSVSVPRRPVCCRRPLFEYGMLGRARRELRQILDRLQPVIAANTPVVFLEPSCLSVFRDELVNLFPRSQTARQLSRQSFLLTEFLINVADYRPPRLEGTALVHGHCHQKALVGMEADRTLYERMELKAQLPDFGCCGLAGPFGYRQEHYGISLQIGEHGLLPAVRKESADSLIVANGFSCRQQIAHATGRDALHPAEVLRMAIDRHQTSLPITSPKWRRAARAIPAVAALLAIAAAGVSYVNSA